MFLAYSLKFNLTEANVTVIYTLVTLTTMIGTLPDDTTLFVPENCLYQRFKLLSAIETILRKPILVFGNINPGTTIRTFDIGVAYLSATGSEVVGIQ